MVRLDLKEIDDWVPVHLDAAHADLLAASEAVAIRPFGRRTWKVKASGWVGAATLGEPDGPQIDLRVQPKIPIERLLFLMGYAHNSKGWRDEVIDAPAAPDVPTAIAEAFIRLTDRALRQGVLQGYRTVEEAGMTLRGRLREKDQILRRFGKPLPVEVTYDDYGPDVAENQILKAALWRMLAIPGLDGHVGRRLIRLRRRLSDVSNLTGGQDLPHWTPSRLNSRYVPALKLAELILRSSSFDLGRGAVPAVGFLISMPFVFEDFVAAALTEALQSRFRGRCVAQDKRWYLDAGHEVKLRPDLVWYPGERRNQGDPQLVIDVKYKAESYSGFPNPDIYQLLAYCSALALPVGHLIYAKGNEQGTSFNIPGTGPKGAGVHVHAHTLDLNVGPEELLEQVDRLGTLLIELREPATCS